MVGVPIQRDVVMPGTVELQSLSLDELKRLGKIIEDRIVQLEQEQLGRALAAAQEATLEFGFSLEQVLNKSKKKVSRPRKSPAPPRYRNPSSPNETWSGRGRQPTWFKSAVENGSKREDLKI